MARQSIAKEINSQVIGLVTEASPLTFPEKASVDEVNFDLHRDGSRSRRNGVDLISSAPVTQVSFDAQEVYSHFIWDEVYSNSVHQQFLVVQVAKTVHIYRISAQAPFEEIYTKNLLSAIDGIAFGFTQLGGRLYVSSGRAEILILEYDGTSIVEYTDTLKIRDLFGVEDVEDSVDLRSVSGLTKRPETLTNAHLYNLRNQTWAFPYKPNNTEVMDDPIYWFNDESDTYPSNADNMLSSVAPLTDDSDDRVGMRFHSKAAVSNPPPQMSAPKGFFVIDALSRGESRYEAAQSLYNKYSTSGPSSGNAFRYEVGELPADETLGGSSVVQAHSGRIFYTGFSGAVVDGDRHSPNLGSYILYSQLVKDKEQATRCYQEGDPTSLDTPDLVDTDGGFIEISGSVGINKLVTLGSYLLVFASNGVWAIAGGSGYGFSATNYLVDKVSSNGCINPESVVQAGQSIFFWSDAGIFEISLSDEGFGEVNISVNRIQKYYNEISNSAKRRCRGVFEKPEDRIRWMYQESGEVKELILDLSLGAFYPQKYPTEGE